VGRLKSRAAIAIRRQSQQLIRDLSVVPFLYCSNSIRSLGVGKQSPAEGIQLVPPPPSQAAEMYAMGPMGSLFEDAIRDPGESIKQAARSANSSFLKGRQANLGVFYAQSKGLRPIPKNPIVLKEQLEEYSDNNVRVMLMHAFRQKNMSRLPELRKEDEL
jgi:hypothetical protein